MQYRDLQSKLDFMQKQSDMEKIQVLFFQKTHCWSYITFIQAIEIHLCKKILLTFDLSMPQAAERQNEIKNTMMMQLDELKADLQSVRKTEVSSNE